MPCNPFCCVRPGTEDVRELDFSHCSLSDVPSEVFVYERTLERLHCQSNRVTELPRQLFICHELKVLNVSDNEIQELPSAISSLVNLQLLDCSKNAISTLPDTIKCLKQLFVLDLSVNPLEKLPEAITNLIFLQELFLNDVYLEYLPGNFGRLTSLKLLELRDNYLMILPKSMVRSAELARLDIGQNEFTEFPEVIGKFCQLQELWVDCNSLVSIPSVVENLTKLIHLEASNNLIAEIAPEISFCRDLVELCLSNNQLNQLPESIGGLVNLVSLKLDSNKLFTLPDSIGDLESLEELMLTSNFLYELPPSIGRLKKLECLNVDENMLKVIPPEIGKCSSLTVLSLRSNRLGFVPGEIGNLTKLKVLNLVRNSLQSLPQTLLNCGSLVALWLSENQSKPLVPMQSEVDARTRQLVLTCFLFPQVTLSGPSDASANDRKSYISDAQNSARHISFVDMKAAAKGAHEKPGQLRRAPTPYPKELRALAKHARNIQKDPAEESLLQNAVHIKAAKITPTLQQRFASNHSIGAIRNVNNEWYDSSAEVPQHKAADSPLLSPNSENPYDRPIDLEEHKSYQNLDQTIYSESNDSAYGGYNDQLCVRVDENPYGESVPFSPNTVEDRVDGIIQRTSHDLYQMARQGVANNSSPVVMPSFDSISTGNRNSISSNISQGNQVYSRSREMYNPSPAENFNGSPAPLQNNLNNSGRLSQEGVYGLCSPYVETYAQAKEKIYGTRRRDDKYSHYPAYQTNSAYYTGPGNPNRTPDALGNYSTNNMHPQVFFSNKSSVSPQGKDISNVDRKSDSGSNNLSVSYIHQNNTNSNVDLAYDTASVSSKQGIYGHAITMPCYNNYNNIYETMPNANNILNHSDQLSVHSVSPSKLNPPPYHIAATYSKQAHFFNANS